MEPNGVGTPLAIRQTKQENKGSKPKATSILAGMAMAVCAALDAMKWTEIVGSIAGDDTIMCAVRSVEDTVKVMDKIRKIVL